MFDSRPEPHHSIVHRGPTVDVERCDSPITLHRVLFGSCCAITQFAELLEGPVIVTTPKPKPKKKGKVCASASNSLKFGLLRHLLGVGRGSVSDRRRAALFDVERQSKLVDDPPGGINKNPHWPDVACVSLGKALSSKKASFKRPSKKKSGATILPCFRHVCAGALSSGLGTRASTGFEGSIFERHCPPVSPKRMPPDHSMPRA